MFYFLIHWPTWLITYSYHLSEIKWCFSIVKLKCMVHMNTEIKAKKNEFFENDIVLFFFPSYIDNEKFHNHKFWQEISRQFVEKMLLLELYIQNIAQMGTIVPVIETNYFNWFPDGKSHSCKEWMFFIFDQQ